MAEAKHIRRRVTAGIAAGAVLGGGAWIGSELVNNAQQAAAEQDTRNEQVKAFSQSNLAEIYSQPKSDVNRFSGRIALYRVVEGDTPITIGQKLGSEDVSDTADEIVGQEGDIIYPGDTVALPMEDLDPELITELEPSSQIHPSWNETHDQNASDPYVTFVVPR